VTTRRAARARDGNVPAGIVQGFALIKVLPAA
jgi:hypothetical protein